MVRYTDRNWKIIVANSQFFNHVRYRLCLNSLVCIGEGWPVKKIIEFIFIERIYRGEMFEEVRMKNIVEKLLKQAGIAIGGNDPWDIQVHDDRFYYEVARAPSLGLGETYVEGWWDCNRIDEFFHRIFESRIDTKAQVGFRDTMTYFLHRIMNFQTKGRAKEVAVKHYNIGNTLYEAMLGSTMNYSCGYWKNAFTLDAAEKDKMDLICRKLMLAPGMRLLDIGCGWGALAKYAAEHYGVEVVGATISEPQRQYAADLCRGFPVTILGIDYRDLPKETFDRVVSVGMFEHVGYKNYAEFMKIVSERLADDGIFLLHTIGSNGSYASGDPWIEKYIFPNGMLPSVAQIAGAIEGLFVLEDWHNFGYDYSRTLMAWHQNFNDKWDELKGLYDEKFHRMWNYYLLSCAGSFRARHNQLWQVVMSKSGVRGGYRFRDL